MTPAVIGCVGLLILFALMAIGMPIGFAMALVGFVGYAVVAGWQGALTNLATVPYISVASYVMSTLPLFMLMGQLAAVSGLIGGAYSFLHKVLGRLRGGLAISTIGACAAFAAVCGSSMATATTMTTVALPQMKRYNYDPKLSLGSIAAGGTLGILIPPSIPMIIYSLFTEESIGKLFMGGVIPGFLLAGLMMLTVYIWVRFTPSLAPAGPGATWREKLAASLGIWPVLILAVFILGGMWGGIFSATEAGGVGAFGALVIALSRRQLTIRNTTSALMDTMSATAMIFTILIGAMIFNYFIVVTGVPAALTGFVETLHLSPMGVLVAILFVYLILGSIMDTLAMTVLTLPIFVPILTHLGFNLVWFGIVFVIMSEMAMITPPIGMNVFVVTGMAKDVPMYTVFRGIAPFLVPMIVCVILVVVFPQIVLFLPNAMIK